MQELRPDTQQLTHGTRVSAVRARARQQHIQPGIATPRCLKPTLTQIQVHAQHGMTVRRERAQTPKRPQPNRAGSHQAALPVRGA